MTVLGKAEPWGKEDESDEREGGRDVDAPQTEDRHKLLEFVG